jgi:hypothetical protein
MKEHHLKRYIDRLMLVPRSPKAGGDDTPIGHAGADLPNPKTPLGDKGLFDDGDDKEMDPLEHAQMVDRDHLTDEHEENGPGLSPADHEDKENEMGGGLKDLLSQKNPSLGDHKAVGSGLHSVKGKASSPKPQTVTEPHAMLKEGNLSAEDHEKRVKMERARHARIFGD